MRVDILTCLPKLLESPFAHSILKRAIDRNLLNLHIHDLRDYSLDKHKKVDDYAYGGAAGMVLAIPPIASCINQLKEKVAYQEIIYMAPDGELLTQQLANQLSMQENLLILCGHYKGVDERVRQHFVTRAISIGDYVLSGGELAAAVLVDAIVRLLPGVLSDETSALTDSFQDNLVAPPVYTRPYNFQGMCVPDILLSGNEKAIREWEYQTAIERTKQLRPELYNKFNTDVE
ncbi:tRNA (guanine-N1)-methyltransferase [Candidatus Amoebophilus asiaticus 5a2]|uniref:tRNA (guanine-N(1)-)-methyltransferase n=1 Tax=Amoebophilus asiaticus (strain 5a2) TaxID=452471 RepID=B3EU48_AMOA5|nr:tRNA (guanosine(37)-N1)-methyltransferase TrmD [Candidatus Amoebophilus asiaticus]ACE05467.1 tRNA (guanine-N1)-methyltransferase [Candidatus Amoebophilus asiaticus 5a2]